MSVRFTHALSATIAAVGLLGHLTAFAAIVVAPARFDESLRIFTSTPTGGQTGTDIFKPEIVSTSFISAFGTAFNGTVSTSAAPVIQAQLTQAGGDGTFVGGAGIVYQIAYEGPATSTLPVFILTSGAVSVAGGDASAIVSIVVRPLAGGAPAVLFRQASASTFGAPSDSFTVTTAGGPVLLQANTIYEIGMNANLSVDGSDSGPASSATAFLDPAFMIDPTFANAGLYTFIQSSGIAPVPEPGRVALLSAGGLLLAGLLRRRGRSMRRPETGRA